MISFKPTLVTIKYPGYYWDILEKELYSIKIGGVLKKLRKKFPTHFEKRYFRYDVGSFYYVLSHKGRRKICPAKYLEKLKHINSTIPMENS